MSNYLKYVGDRIVSDHEDLSAFNVRDGALLHRSGFVSGDSAVSVKSYLRINGEWVEVDGGMGSASMEQMQKISGDLIASGTFLEEKIDECCESIGDGFSILDNPSDGAYGSDGGVAGIKSGDTHEDAFDKVEDIFEKLAPKKPKSIDDVNLYIEETIYEAYESGTFDLKQNIVEQQDITITHEEPFFDPEEGYLIVRKNDVETGKIQLTEEDDSSTNGVLEITENIDPFSGEFGKQDFWTQLMVDINLASLSDGEQFDIDLLQDSNGKETSLTGYFSLSVTETFMQTLVNNTTFSQLSNRVNGTNKIINGVPSFSDGEIELENLKTQGQVNHFYTKNYLTKVFLEEHNNNSSIDYTKDDISQPSPPVANTDIEFNNKFITLNNVDKKNPNLKIELYDYRDVKILEKTIPTNLYSDSSIQKENRRDSGTGLYPTNFGGSYTSINDQDLSQNEELQLSFGEIFYPNLDYSSYLPQGPNYSNLGGTSTNDDIRWYTIFAGSGSNKNLIDITISYSQNPSSSIVDIDESLKPIYLYGIVKNQTGWINGNLPYDIFTNHTPTSDGEGGMLTSTYENSLTTTRRKIFFGRTTYTGDFYVRLGIPKQYDNQYNDFKFTNLEATLDTLIFQVPPKPNTLSSLELEQDTKTVYQQGTKNQVSAVFVTNVSALSNEFYDANEGDLTARNSTDLLGEITLTSNSDVGIDGGLEVLSDVDAYENQNVITNKRWYYILQCKVFDAISNESFFELKLKYEKPSESINVEKSAGNLYCALPLVGTDSPSIQYNTVDGYYNDPSNGTLIDGIIYYNSYNANNEYVKSKITDIQSNGCVGGSYNPRLDITNSDVNQFNISDVSNTPNKNGPIVYSTEINVNSNSNTAVLKSYNSQDTQVSSQTVSVIKKSDLTAPIVSRYNTSAFANISASQRTDSASYNNNSTTISSYNYADANFNPSTDLFYYDGNTTTGLFTYKLSSQLDTFGNETTNHHNASGYKYAYFVTTLSGSRNIIINIANASSWDWNQQSTILTPNVEILVKIPNGNVYNANSPWNGNAPQNGDGVVSMQYTSGANARFCNLGTIINGKVYVKIGINSNNRNFGKVTFS